VKSKFLFAPFLFCFAILFVSCDTFMLHDFEIKNDSSCDVSFRLVKYSDKNIYALASGASLILDLYDQPDIEFINHERVYFVSGNSSGHIYDLQKYSYLVVNNGNYDVHLSEKNGMLGDTFGNVEKISRQGTKKIFVYTDNPKWNATFCIEECEYDGISLLTFIRN
jgi:hypothetical protein